MMKCAGIELICLDNVVVNIFQWSRTIPSARVSRILCSWKKIQMRLLTSISKCFQALYGEEFMQIV